MQTGTGNTCGWAPVHLPGPPRKQVVMAVEVGGGPEERGSTRRSAGTWAPRDAGKPGGCANKTRFCGARSVGSGTTLGEG